MKHFVVIFNKPVILPGDKLKKIKTYGLLFEKTEIATFDRMSNYIRNYILAVVEIFKDGVEQFDEWGYKKNGNVFYVNDSNWWQYVERAEKAKVRFAILDDDGVEIKTEDFNEDYLLTSKERWTELKASKEIVWN